MMKADLSFQDWMRRLAGALLVAVAGCAAQTPVANVPVEQQSYEQMFEIAVKAMKKMGNVQAASRELGTIVGMTPSGVTLEVQIVRDAGRTPQLQVQAVLPEGMTGMGNISEPDRYLDIYRKLSQR